MHWLLLLDLKMYAAGGIAICISFNREKKMKMKRKKNIWAIGPFIVWKITCAQHLFLFRSSAAIKPTIGYLVEQGIISEPEKREWKKDIHTHIHCIKWTKKEEESLNAMPYIIMLFRIQWNQADFRCRSKGWKVKLKQSTQFSYDLVFVIILKEFLPHSFSYTGSHSVISSLYFDVNASTS